MQTGDLSEIYQSTLGGVDSEDGTPWDNPWTLPTGTLLSLGEYHAYTHTHTQATYGYSTVLYILS